MKNKGRATTTKINKGKGRWKSEEEEFRDLKGEVKEEEN